MSYKTFDILSRLGKWYDIFEISETRHLGHREHLLDHKMFGTFRTLVNGTLKNCDMGYLGYLEQLGHEIFGTLTAFVNGSVEKCDVRYFVHLVVLVYNAFMSEMDIWVT